MADDQDRTGVVDPPADDAAIPPDAERPRGRSAPASRLPWVVAGVSLLVAAIAIVVAVILVTDARGSFDAELDAIERTAGSFALSLTTWDASDGMGDTREDLRAAGTPSFAEDVDELFGGTDDLATLEELGARSSGEVDDVLVQSVEGDEAVALVVVLQRVTTEVTEGEEVSLRYARLHLLREGGDWRINEVELVVDALQQAAERTDPTELPGFGGLDADDATDEGAP